MKAKLIVYKIANLKQSAKVKFNREFFGGIETSNNSKYKYKKEGILGKILYVKLAKSVIVVMKKDFDLISDFLSKMSAEFKVYDIDVKKNEFG